MLEQQGEQHSPVRLAVILLNWRDEPRTLRCARSVMSWEALKPRLIVVDNESSESTCRMLSAALAAENVICSSTNLGYGGGNNLGIRRAMAEGIEYILLLNTDVEIAADDVGRLLDRLDGHRDIAVLSPIIREAGECFVGARDVARYSFTRNRVPSNGLKEFVDYPVHEVAYVSGMFLLARSRLFANIGVLDEDYFFGGEIADLCERARDGGYKICVDLEVVARHNADQTPAHLRKSLYAYYTLRNRFLFVRKRRSGERFRYFFYWTVFGAAGIGRALLRGEMSRARAMALALLDAHAGRYGNQNDKFL